MSFSEPKHSDLGFSQLSTSPKPGSQAGSQHQPGRKSGSARGRRKQEEPNLSVSVPNLLNTGQEILVRGLFKRS